jgi:hypothetical protein
MSSTTPGSDPEQRPAAGPVDDAAEVREPAQPDPQDTAAYEPAEPLPEPEAASDTPEADDAAVPPVTRSTASDSHDVDGDASATTAPAAATTAVEPDYVYEAEPAAAVDEPVEPAPTSRLDEAVERANAVPVASDPNDVGDRDVPEPIAAEAVRHETYVPSATVATGAAGAATLAPEPEPPAELAPPAPAAPQTVYVQAPTPPKMRSNRGFGLLVALIGTVVFALLYAGVSYLILLGRGDVAQASSVFTQFLLQPVFWVPVVAFFVGFAVLTLIVNRGPWWCYAVFGLLVGVFVYLSYIGAALLTVQAWTFSIDQANDFVAQRWLDPFAIVAGVIALEIPIWLGGWIASRGRAVSERNRLAREAYDRELAAGPQPQRA